jgi:hypothetical protein
MSSLVSVYEPLGLSLIARCFYGLIQGAPLLLSPPTIQPALMSGIFSSKAAQLWAKRIAQSQRSNLPDAQFFRSIDCSLRCFYLWNRKLVASPKKRRFLRTLTSEHTPDSIEDSSVTDTVRLREQTEKWKIGGAPNHNRFPLIESTVDDANKASIPQANRAGSVRFFLYV